MVFCLGCAGDTHKRFRAYHRSQWSNSRQTRWIHRKNQHKEHPYRNWFRSCTFPWSWGRHDCWWVVTKAVIKTLLWETILIHLVHGWFCWYLRFISCYTSASDWWETNCFFYWCTFPQQSARENDRHWCWCYWCGAGQLHLKLNCQSFIPKIIEDSIS